MFGSFLRKKRLLRRPAVINKHTSDAHMITIFKVGDKYYPANEVNTQLFETYLHTGEQKYLQALTDEVEL